MVPPNHVSLLIASGRRAKEWRMGLRRQGFAAQSIETSGSDAAKGDFWLVVPEEQRFPAQRFVSDVLAGKQSLPASAPVSGPLLWGAAVIVLAMLALTLVALFS
jgi:hypothetical protein